MRSERSQKAVVRPGVRAVWLAVVCLAWVAAGSSSVRAEDWRVGEGGMPATPAEYERYALRHDSELRLLYERWRSASSAAEAADAGWPQPRVGYQAFIDGFWLNDNSVTHIGTVSQKFPWPGVLDEASDPEAERAEALRYRFEARALEVVAEVRSALIEIARLDRKREILEEQVAVYEDVASLVERSMESDEADYGDLLRVRAAREKLVDRVDHLESMREQTVAELREVSNVPVDAELTFRLQGDHDPFAVGDGDPDRRALVKSAREHHPSLKADAASARARFERAEYSRMKRLPEPTVSLGVRSMPDYMGISGYDRRTAFILGFSIPVPIFGAQYERAFERHEYEGLASLSARRGTRQRLVAKIDASAARIVEKRRRLERYRQELLPLASDASEQMLQQIETGEERLTDYLLSFEQELDLETNVVDFRAAIARERVRLERLTGGAHDAYPDRTSPDIEIEDVEASKENHE